jgi:hypothetical protein
MLLEANGPAISWTEVLAVPGIGAALFVCWMFLKHLREQRDADHEAAKQRIEEASRKDAHVERIAADFSQTIRAVSLDVKQGLDRLHETTSSLLLDGRERESRLHDLFREVSSKKNPPSST